MNRWETCGTVMRKTKAEKKAGKFELDKYALLGLVDERHTASEQQIKEGASLLQRPHHDSRQSPGWCTPRFFACVRLSSAPAGNTYF